MKWAETSPRGAPRPKCAQLFKIKRDQNSTARLFFRGGGLPLVAEKEDMFCKKKSIVAVRPVSILMFPVAYLRGPPGSQGDGNALHHAGGSRINRQLPPPSKLICRRAQSPGFATPISGADS